MQTFLKHLLQQRCLVCAAPIPKADLEKNPEVFAPWLCPECQAKLKPLPQGFCPRCGEIYAPGVSGLCPGCQHSPPPWGRTYFYAAYSGLLRELIHRLKFNGVLHLAPALGRLLAMQPELAAAAGAYDCIVPIPLHSARLLERGFNQSTEIAKNLGKILGLPLLNGLQRHNHTRKQTGLSREQRLQNLRGAFQALAPVQGKNILLLDDVMTTGATLGVAARALLQGGAMRVDVAAIARTPARNMLQAVRQS